MESERLRDEIGGILRDAGGEGDGPVLVVNPSQPLISSVVVTLSDTPDPPPVQLLSDEDSLKAVLGDFIVASRAAGLIADGTLSLRVLEGTPRNSLVVDESAVVSLVYADGAVEGIRADDGAFVDRARDHYEDRWAAAGEYTLRTPPLSRVYETLEADIGADAAADFETVLGALDVARGGGEGLDEVTISLLVAARNGVLLYDISRWGEDVGLASKATFSRTKTALEDGGLLDTEKVPIDVGRPRLRLRLGDERLEDADPAELPAVAQSLLED